MMTRMSFVTGKGSGQGPGKPEDLRGKRDMMQDRLNIAVYVDYDNIELGLRSTLRRDFDVSLPLSALKERGDLVAKFAYANWGRQETATRLMAENAVQMVQRIPSPRGDKNGADINLALDALEMAFTHAHVNAFAIISGDSDFIPLVNKLKEYGKTVFVVGGKGFTSTILQQNCHEFISYESLLEDGDRIVVTPMPDRRDRPNLLDRPDRPERAERPERGPERGRDRRERGQRPAPLDLTQAMPLVERALQVLERRAVQPQLGLLKSTMLQLDPAFSERAYGANSFSDFIERLKKADFVNVSGSGGRYIIERRGGGSDKPAPNPDEALPGLRDVLETHRLDIEMNDGSTAEDLEEWMRAEQPNFTPQKYGFQQFNEFLNYAQDKTVVRVIPDEDRGPIVYLGAEFYPPALPHVEPEATTEEDDDGPQPIVEGQPTIFEPNPPPPKPKKQASRPRKTTSSAARKPRKKKGE
jgi:uncharacterized protein (TIGR00288 family)